MTECTHPNSEFRYRRMTNGSAHLGRQCLTCGRLVGSWIPHDGHDHPDWDMTLADRYWSGGEQESFL